MNEIDLVIWQQHKFSSYDNFFYHISDIANPRTELLYFSPLIYYLYLYSNRYTNGLTVLISLLLADWLNLNLKFIFEGDRPYWLSNDEVNQFDTTCETGYGMPSGHCMVSSAFSLMSFFYYIKIEKK